MGLFRNGIREYYQIQKNILHLRSRENEAQQIIKELNRYFCW